ncbi:hypothetical protein M758_8G185700 [Ceratodon purpureus]|uniref:SigF-like NTF2-like domain-containing protein n=1 Tax=Ceratodon purpureus TaxID=3225 RepID=A0A8T0H5K6_CERPU|nr:hypothetical protein KC19_8G190600 [Ceratodon purpureus]KAG0609456.1 hypothetical protein M758_8G185700 [Ceratodon purpureus]
MEDPANEVEGVVRALVDKPTLRRQAETLKKYATNDVEFYHFYANVNSGLRALIAMYQAAQFFLNYSGVDFHNIVYDADKNNIAVRATVYVRPWVLLWRTVPLRLFILLELQDVIVNGKTVKKIRVQRDYFIRAPAVEFIPIIGDIYDSESLRFFWGNTLAFLVQFFQWLISALFPPKYWQSWLGLDSGDVAMRRD